MGGPIWRGFINKSRFLLEMCVEVALLHGLVNALPALWDNLYRSFAFVEWYGNDRIDLMGLFTFEN